MRVNRSGVPTKVRIHRVALLIRYEGVGHQDNQFQRGRYTKKDVKSF